MSTAGRVNAAIIAAGNILKKFILILQTVEIESGTSNDSKGSEAIEVSGDDIAAPQMGR
jgi:hypothetical protein